VRDRVPDHFVGAPEETISGSEREDKRRFL